MLVKVCGIRDERDALDCVHVGVDVLGFHLWPDSARAIEPRDARRIVERLPAWTVKVGVFADEDPARIRQVAREVGLNAVQLHGDESPEECASLAPLVWFKAFRVGARFRPEALARYACTTYLLDGWKPTGMASPTEGFDWVRAKGLALHGRIVISGGLDPESVGLAVEHAVPYGVDVASGVEFAPGKKDVDRVEAFVKAVREAEARLDEAAASRGRSR